MRRLLMVAMLAVFFSFFLRGSSVVSAAVPKVVISQVQAGALSTDPSITTETAPTKEYVSIYNNDIIDIDVTNWCLTNKSNLIFGCFDSGEVNIKYILPSYGFATISSDSFSIQNLYKPDFTYPTTNHSSGNITGSSDIISLVGIGGELIDSVSWTDSLAGGSVLNRKYISGSEGEMYDTGVIGDFIKSTNLKIAPSSLNEVLIQIDTCPNIDEIQVDVPAGYVKNDLGDCIIPVDVCKNIGGVQETIPLGYGLDENADCVNLDVCPNIEDVQLVVPEMFEVSEDGECVAILPELKINELLANAIGDDDGNEFIELYNPNDLPVNLVFYKLQVGTKSYEFPLGDYIAPRGYKTYSDHEINFTLANSGSYVELRTIFGEILDSVSYGNAEDGMAWALVNGVWQFTNQPTPNMPNLASLEDDLNDEGEVLGAKICAPNQYLNKDTNRCRLIVTLTPCKDGQYRSEETNRCRSIASDASILEPCAPNQERNPETNRCRLIAEVNGDQAPCKEGQERNPVTNRCRNITSAIPEAEYKVEPISVIRSSMDLWILGGVIVVAFSYAAWEWRYELRQLLIKLRAFLHLHK